MHILNLRQKRFLSDYTYAESVDVLRLMMTLLVNIVFPLFAVGLLTVGTLLVRRFTSQEQVDSGNCLLLGLLAYMLLCNIALLAPPFLQVLPLPFAASEWLAISAHQIAMTLLVVIILFLASVGILLQAPLVNPLRVKVISLPVYRHFKNIDVKPLDTAIILIAVSCFWFVVVKGDGMNGDTGLYHMPITFHLGRIGLEWGVANWDWRHTTYSAFFYGQAPFQMMVGNVYASPSLNILFFASLLLYAKNQLLNQFLSPHLSQQVNAPVNIRTLAAITYFILAIFYGLEPRSSLVSFNPDFALACVTLIAVFNATSLGGFGSGLSSNEIFWFCTHLIFLWMLKLTAVFSIIGLAIIILLNDLPLLLRGSPCFMRSMICRMTPRTFRDTIDLAGLSLQYVSRIKKARCKMLALVLAISLLTYCSTVAISSGFLLPKHQLFGPLTHYSIPSRLLGNTKLELNFNRTRWSGQTPEIISQVDKDKSRWFMYWSQSKEGKVLLGSIAISSISSAVYILNSARALRSRNTQSWLFLASVKLAILSTSVAISASALVLFGPPHLRFATWILSLSFYVAISMFYLYPIIAWSSWLAIGAILSTVTPKTLLERIPVPSYTVEYRKIMPGWAWRPRLSTDGKVPYSKITDEAKLCWAAPSPCSSADSIK